MASGPEHYTEAERLRAKADEWNDADLGWKANLTAQERINQRLADLADAQVHATLALAAATALGTHGGMDYLDHEAWDRVAGVQEDDEDADEDMSAELVAIDGADDGDENHYSRAQLDGETCTECGGVFAEGEATVPSVHDFIEGQLFAHAACAQEPATRPVEHVDYAEAEAVREIREEMALEAAGVESWEEL